MIDLDGLCQVVPIGEENAQTAGRSRRQSHTSKARRLTPAGFPFWLWRPRRAVDPAFHGRSFGTRVLAPAGQIWRPTVVRTFFESPGGWYS